MISKVKRDLTRLSKSTETPKVSLFEWPLLIFGGKRRREHNSDYSSLNLAGPQPHFFVLVGDHRLTRSGISVSYGNSRPQFGESSLTLCHLEGSEGPFTNNSIIHEVHHNEKGKFHSVTLVKLLLFTDGSLRNKFPSKVILLLIIYEIVMCIILRRVETTFVT